MTDEWTALDSKTDRLKFVHADTQREAIRKALYKYDIVPRKTDDVRPRTGTQSIMSTEEFDDFMEDLAQS